MSAAKTPSQRVSETKARKRAAGLVEVRSLWAHREDQPAIRKFASDLTNKRKEPTMSKEPTIATILADAKNAGYEVTKSVNKVNGATAYKIVGRPGLFTKTGLMQLLGIYG
jgi:hypothetical protein